MDSRRLPGKSLAPLNGRPILARVVARLAEFVDRERITVTTSVAESDDPLAAYVPTLGVSLHRGPLAHVFQRFQDSVRAFPCAWCFRVSGDSPFFDGSLIPRLLEHREREDVDLVTNVFPRTFPRGHSLEMIRSATLLAVDPESLAGDEREHVTTFFYKRADRFSIVNVESGRVGVAREAYTVDTLEDLRRLEELEREGGLVAGPAPEAKAT